MTEPHQAETVLRSVYTDEEGTVSSRAAVNDAIREALVLVARLRAERDTARRHLNIANGSLIATENERRGWQARAEAAETCVAELEAERDAAAKSRDEYREGWLLRGRQMNEDRDGAECPTSDIAVDSTHPDP